MGEVGGDVGGGVGEGNRGDVGVGAVGVGIGGEDAGKLADAKGHAVVEGAVEIEGRRVGADQNDLVRQAVGPGQVDLGPALSGGGPGREGGPAGYQQLGEVDVIDAGAVDGDVLVEAGEGQLDLLVGQRREVESAEFGGRALDREQEAGRDGVEDARVIDRLGGGDGDRRRQGVGESDRNGEASTGEGGGECVQAPLQVGRSVRDRTDHGGVADVNGSPCSLVEYGGIAIFNGR